MTNQTWTAADISHWRGELANELENNILAEIKTAMDDKVIEQTDAKEAGRALHKAAQELRKPKPNLIGILSGIFQVIGFIANILPLIGMSADLAMASLAIRLLLESTDGRK